MANGDDNAQTVPRIYILFPTLLGPVPRWHERLPAIAEMGFDWIFLNPVHLPGASGSLYAIKDTRRLHPLLLGPEADAGVDAPTEPGSNAGSDSGSGTGPGEGDRLLRDFCAAAADAGIRVMLDLVIKHSARDGVLVARHPEWFAKDRNGDIRPPSVADLGDPEQVTVWEDLAELDYRERPERAAIIEHWQALVSRYLSIGFAGFRCDAAYIGRVNAMKAATPVLNVEGRQQRVTDPDAPLVGLLRRSRRGPQRSLVLINPDRSQTERLDSAAIAEWLDSAPDDIREITPEKPANKPAQNHARGSGARAAANWHEADEVRVSPRDIRVFVRVPRQGADAA